MAQWKKLLVRMLEDTDPRNYTYDEAAQVLEHLGFALAPVSGTSHRKWRCRKGDGTVVVVGLKQQGYGTLKLVEFDHGEACWDNFVGAGKHLRCDIVADRFAARCDCPV